MNHAELTRLLKYDQITGQFHWREARRAGAKAGDLAGCLDLPRKKGQSYWRIVVSGKRYAAHRLAWFYVHGRWPEHEIDHINGNALDNRIANLREVDRFSNAQNLRKARSDSSTGLIGVRRVPSGAFSASIQAFGVRRRLGQFATAEEAFAAYVEAKRAAHPACTI